MDCKMSNATETKNVWKLLLIQASLTNVTKSELFKQNIRTVLLTHRAGDYLQLHSLFSEVRFNHVMRNTLRNSLCAKGPLVYQKQKAFQLFIPLEITSDPYHISHKINTLCNSVNFRKRSNTSARILWREGVIREGVDWPPWYLWGVETAS